MPSHRRPTSGASSWRVGILLAFLLVPGALDAQIVHGRLLDNESRKPVVNGTVALFDSLGTTAARVMADDEGRFTLTVPGPGRYTIRGWGLGYRGGLQPELHLGEGEEVALDLYLGA